jgi:hypothetical protein
LDWLDWVFTEQRRSFVKSSSEYAETTHYPVP